MEKEAKILVENVRDFINKAEELHLTNEQWFINFEDDLNKLTVKDHNRNILMGR